jgi:hypothetical protein
MSPSNGQRSTHTPHSTQADALTGNLAYHSLTCLIPCAGTWSTFQVQLFISAPSFAAAVQLENDRPQFGAVGFIADGQIEQVLSIVVGRRAVVWSAQQLRWCLIRAYGAHRSVLRDLRPEKDSNPKVGVIARQTLQGGL